MASGLLPDVRQWCLSVFYFLAWFFSFRCLASCDMSDGCPGARLGVDAASYGEYTSDRPPSPVTLAASCDGVHFAQKGWEVRRKRAECAFDVVMPHSVTVTNHVRKLAYKEIPTPWCGLWCNCVCVCACRRVWFCGELKVISARLLLYRCGRRKGSKKLW